MDLSYCLYKIFKTIHPYIPPLIPPYTKHRCVSTMLQVGSWKLEVGISVLIGTHSCPDAY